MVSELKSEDRCDLQGHLEAAMASEATQMVRGNIHLDIRVTKIANFISPIARKSKGPLPSCLGWI